MSPAGSQRPDGQKMVVEGNLEAKMLEAQVESLMSKVKATEQLLEQLRGENEILKQRINEKEPTSNQNARDMRGGRGRRHGGEAGTSGTKMIANEVIKTGSSGNGTAGRTAGVTNDGPIDGNVEGRRND